MKSVKSPLISVQNEIKNLLKKGISEGVFPAAAAGIFQGLGKEKKVFTSFYGNAAIYPEKRVLKKNNFFDLASLTKPLATTMAILCLMKEKKIDIDETLPSLLEIKIKGKKRKIKAKHLLNHSSGLPAHREYFKMLKDIPQKEKSKVVENLILQERQEYIPGTASIYSDLGFMLLGSIIEKKSGCGLEYYVAEKVLKPLNLEKKIFYKPLFQEKSRFDKKILLPQKTAPGEKKYYLAKYMMIIVIPWGELQDTAVYSEILMVLRHI